MKNIDWDTIERIVKILAGIVAVVTLGKAVYEYMQQSREKRGKQFIDLRNYFRGNEGFQNIIEHLYGDNNFSSVSNHTKIEFMAFFEDIAFLMNSGLIRKEVVFYMFGGDAITAWSNDIFWSQDLRNDKFWSLLTDFVNQMKEIKETFQYDRTSIRL